MRDALFHECLYAEGQGGAACFHEDGCFPPLALFDCRYILSKSYCIV